MWAWILRVVVPFLLRGLGVQGQTVARQPDAEAQDKRAEATVQAARAETQLNDQQAAVAAQGASNATVTRAADDAAAVGRASVSNPASIDADPHGHWRD